MVGSIKLGPEPELRAEEGEVASNDSITKEDVGDGNGGKVGCFGIKVIEELDSLADDLECSFELLVGFVFNSLNQTGYFYLFILCPFQLHQTVLNLLTHCLSTSAGPFHD